MRTPRYQDTWSKIRLDLLKKINLTGFHCNLVSRTQGLRHLKEMVREEWEIVIFQENIEEHARNMEIYRPKNVDIMVVASEEMKNPNAIDQEVQMK